MHGEKYSQAVHFLLATDYNEAIANFMKSDGPKRAKVDAKCVPDLTNNTRKFQLISAGMSLFRLDDIFTQSKLASPEDLVSDNGGQHLDAPTATLIKMRRAGVNAWDLAELLRLPNDPKWSLEGPMEDMLYILTRGCPTLQIILHQIKR